MKKLIAILAAALIIQTVAITLFCLPKNEPVKFKEDDYGEYQISSCQYGDDVMQEINEKITKYKAEQTEKFGGQTDTSIVFVGESRTLYNSGKLTVIEFQTEVRTYVSIDKGGLTGYELKEVDQLWIDGTGGTVTVDFKDSDCNQTNFFGRSLVNYEKNIWQHSTTTTQKQTEVK